ncbi:hypothetical protein Lser_V15G39718 [Lactuca serriola]
MICLGLRDLISDHVRPGHCRHQPLNHIHRVPPSTLTSMVFVVVLARLLNRHLNVAHCIRSYNADAANYSIYVHSEPGFIFGETTRRSSFFYNRQLSNNIKVMLQVDWGESTMIEAERLLLQATIENPANQRFLLLSVVFPCIILPIFTTFSWALLKVSWTGRYNPTMSSIIPMRKWRKGSQDLDKVEF